MKSASVSAIIPTYNSAQLVVQAIESVLAQSVRVAEIIVVDDGSTDDTAERLSRYQDSIRYVWQSNAGVSAARNLGVSLASGEFIAFLDADDVWHPRKTELQLQVFGRDANIALVGTQAFDWPAAQFPSLFPLTMPITNVTWEQMVVRNRLTTSSVMARREAVVRAGPFDTALQGPEDRDLWLRVAEHGRLANLELPLTGYRDVPGSVSKQVEKCRAGMLRILEKIDRQGKWNGRRFLRRRAYSYVDHSCAYLYGAAGLFPQALACSMKSLCQYPLPYYRGDAKCTAERPRRLLASLLRWLRLKRTDVPRCDQTKRANVVANECPPNIAIAMEAASD